MNYFSVVLPPNIDFNEYRKKICFYSTKIQRYEKSGNILKVFCTDDADIDSVKRKIEKSLADAKEKFVHEVKLFSKNDNKCAYSSLNSMENLIITLEEGEIALQGKAVLLFDFFDSVFETIATNLGAHKQRYPVLLSIHTIKKTGYFRRTPQYSIFCSNPVEEFEKLSKMSKDEFCDEEIDLILEKPRYSLSPSACFHTYERYKNQTLDECMTVTFNQSVFRNEGRLNWSEFGRLRDYHVREIVFFGDQKFVENSREEYLKEVEKIIENLNLNADILIASDAFILPKMEKFKLIQLKEKSKYELRLYYDDEQSLAAASFNLHGTAFTKPFNIKIKNVESPVTGCIGFGIERWVLGFLAQYGVEEEKWPKDVRTYISKHDIK